MPGGRPSMPDYLIPTIDRGEATSIEASPWT
jgi:hypothetical protein